MMVGCLSSVYLPDGQDGSKPDGDEDDELKSDKEVEGKEEEEIWRIYLVCMGGDGGGGSKR